MKDLITVEYYMQVAGVGLGTMPNEEIYEIIVRPVKELSPSAQDEVERKLEAKDRDFLSRYKGFASVTYVTASPAPEKSVDPIEGDFRDLFAKIMAEHRNRSASHSSA